jgi:hypothetical protein
VCASAFLSPCCILVVSCGVCSISSKSDSNKDRAGPYIYECVFGTAPDLKWLRIWGCKCYALKPVAERRKDFDDKAHSGFLVGYAQ